MQAQNTLQSKFRKYVARNVGKTISNGSTSHTTAWVVWVRLWVQAEFWVLQLPMLEFKMF